MEKEEWKLRVANSYVQLVIDRLGITVMLSLHKAHLVVTRVSSSCGDDKVSNGTLGSSDISTRVTLSNSFFIVT